MAKAKTFEDLMCWKNARKLTRHVYKMTAKRTCLGSDATLCFQMRKAAVSIISNIAEGFERGGNKEFRQFLSIAKGSAGELRAQLQVALDAELISQETHETAHGLALTVSRQLAAFIRSLKNSGYKGEKFA